MYKTCLVGPTVSSPGDSSLLLPWFECRFNLSPLCISTWQALMFLDYFAINLTASSLLVLVNVLYYCWTPPHLYLYLFCHWKLCGTLGHHRHGSMSQSQITPVFLDVTKSFTVTIGLGAMWSIYLHKRKVFTFHRQEFWIWLHSQTLFTY